MTALDEFTDVKKKSLAVRLEAELLNLEQQTTEEFVIRTLEEFSLTIRKEHITDTEKMCIRDSPFFAATGVRLLQCDNISYFII